MLLPRVASGGASNPVASIKPTLHAHVLLLLFGTSDSMTGREIARAVSPRGSRSSVARALDDLVGQGIVDRRDHPPASLYSLNRDHIGVEALPAMAGLRHTLFERLAAAVRTWTEQPVNVSMFGSTARADGDAASDIDLLVVWRSDSSSAHQVDDRERVIDDVAESARRWTGNRVQPLVMTVSELRTAARRRSPIIGELHRDAITIAGSPLTEMLEGNAKHAERKQPIRTVRPT